MDMASLVLSSQRIRDRLVYNINVNDIDKITGINLYSYGNYTQNASMLLDFLKEKTKIKSERWSTLITLLT